MNNLLNKKIKDKIKLLDDIDKQYISKVEIKKRKNEIPFKKEEPNIYMNSIEIMKNSKKENFDKVYSNFILSGDILGHNYNSKKRNNSINNNNYDKYPTNEDTKYDNVEERLYNYGKYIKNKIEVQRQMENSKIKNSAKPKINKTRNITEKKESRYNQNYKNDINKDNSILNKTNNKSNEKNKNNKNNKSINNIIDINNFTYHPKLNKRSLILAKKMEPSSIRLNKKRKMETEEDLKPKNYYINLYQHKKDNTPRKITEKKKDSKNKSIYDKMNNLYLRGIEQRQKKEKKISENKIKKENEYKEYSYMPNINKIIPYYSHKNRIKKNLNINININGNKKKGSNSKREYKKNIYEKNFEWKKNIVKENIKKKVINEEKIKTLCTFHPKITENSKQPKSNKKLLNKVLEQMNDYVLKRQQNIKYKKSQENYRKKKLYENVDRYTPRSTIPHEFEFQTELREYSLGKNKNRSCENFHKNKNSEKKSFRDNENHFWFFKEDMSSNNYNSNISNINESNNTKEANNHNMQFDFIEAVNLLHDKLDKLNI